LGKVAQASGALRAERPKPKHANVRVERAILDELTKRFPETEGLSYSSKANVFLRKLLLIADAADELGLARPLPVRAAQVAAQPKVLGEGGGER